MSKAVLVMDMPDSCTKCEFADSDNKDWRCIRCKRDNDDYVLRGTKPDWCPLRPLPEKKEISGCSTFTDLGFVSGFNACIDEMVGDNNRNT